MRFRKSLSWKILSIAASVVWLAPARVDSQLFDNLQAFSSRLDMGDPATPSRWEWGKEGPKGVATGDLDADGRPDVAASNLDGTVTVYFNGGEGEYAGPLHLPTANPLEDRAMSLRGIVVEDLVGDELPDIATAALVRSGESVCNSPTTSEVIIFENVGAGNFEEAARLAFDPRQFARDLASGDFDGDGVAELVVAGSGFGLRQYRRSPAGLETVTTVGDVDARGRAKPVYSLAVYRREGDDRDELVLSYARSPIVWTLRAGESGALSVLGEVALEAADWGRYSGAHSIDVAHLLNPVGQGAPDLVTTHKWSGSVHIYRAAATAARFSGEIQQAIQVPGGPRAVRAVDLDGDGWNDLIVALRCLDRVITYRNESGSFVASTELPVGRSPRQLAGADFNGDAHPDYAVINRLSRDANIVTGFNGQVGFGSQDQLYLVDGEVAGMRVLDFNGDGRDDVLQLHRASGDFSVRLAALDGSLGEPEFFPMGEIPEDETIVDVNGDGHQDVVTANLGVVDGSISVRLGDGKGGFGPEMTYALPGNIGGRLFAIEAADFDGDTKIDLAVGFADCRIGFFRGHGDGTFEPTTVHFLVYEARTMAVGDFDHDGDVDLAAAGFAGDLVVLENTGDLLTAERLMREEYGALTSDKFGTRDLKLLDVNHDGDPDLVMGSGDGAIVYLGLPGMDFVLATTVLANSDFPASSVALDDFDGDGHADLAVACHLLSCVTLLTGEGDGTQYLPAVSVDVPAAAFIASGDLDGDGEPDLVGSGDVLWTALSSRAPASAPPGTHEGERKPLDAIVLNEVLAINNRLPSEFDGGRKSDWVEFFNGTDQNVSLAGWRLATLKTPVLGEPEEPERQFEFPADAAIAPGAHLVVTFSNTRRSPYHTGFRLPGSGATLTLFDAAGNQVDRLTYRQQYENVSYARFKDGLRAFVFNNYPSVGASNHENGPVAPSIQLERVRSLSAPEDDPLGLPRSGEAIEFLATGEDDVVVVSASLLYERLDQPDSPVERVILFDDGMNGDGEMQDGVFAGVLPPLPTGAEILFRLEVEDISGAVSVFPEASGDADDVGGGFYSMAPDHDLPGLEISEVLARNDSGLVDAHGGRPDWIEVRNCSAAPIDLDGVYLATAYPANENWYAFPTGTTLAPGEHLVVLADGNTNQGAQHAPFTLRLTGDTVYLIDTTPLGAHGVVDAVAFGNQEPDVSWARRGCAGEWAASTLPTPGAPNDTAYTLGDADLNGVLQLTDGVAILNGLFRGQPLRCPPVADANSDSRLDVSDAVFVLRHLFSGGPPPADETVSCF